MRDVAEEWNPEEVLRWAFAAFEPGIEIASGFGAEGVVLLDLASRICPRLKVFTLDTGYIFPQTLELANKLELRYAMRVERLHSEITLDAQAQTYGPALWNRDPDQCCEIRKIIPLKKKTGKPVRMGDSYPARADNVTKERRKSGVGFKVRAGKDQPNCRLDAGGSMGIHREASARL